MGLCALFCKQRSLHNSRYAIVSKQHRLKPPPLHSTNLKKEKGFFFSFLLDLKRPYLARITSVASAKRDATLMNAKSVRFFEPLGCPPSGRHLARSSVPLSDGAAAPSHRWSGAACIPT
jgi:hypothetical protein